MSSLWVAQLMISDRTAQKIIEVHGIQPGEIRDALVCQRGLPYRWHEHAERGERALVQITLNGRKVLVVLYPAVDALGDTWHLGSAYYVG